MTEKIGKLTVGELKDYTGAVHPVGEVFTYDGETHKVGDTFEFRYKEFSTVAESEWSDKDILDLINTAEKNRERANKYQSIIAQILPKPDPETKALADMVRGFDKFNLPKELVRANMESMLAEKLAADPSLRTKLELVLSK